MNSMSTMDNLKIYLRSVAFGLILLSGSMAGAVISSDIALGDIAALRACTKSCVGDLDFCVAKLVTDEKSKETLIVALNDHCVFELESCLDTCVK